MGRIVDQTVYFILGFTNFIFMPTNEIIATCKKVKVRLD